MIFSYLKLFFIAVLGWGVLPAISYASVKPSFDCAKAQTEAEKLVCADDDLAKLDNELDEWYRQVVEYRTERFHMAKFYDSGEQKGWIKRRDNFDCDSKIADKKSCLLSLYNYQIQMLKNRMLEFELSLVENGCSNSHWKPEGYCNFEKVEALLAEGADINGFSSESCFSGRVFYTALSSPEMLDYVLKHGAKIGLKNPAPCPQGELSWSLGNMVKLVKLGANVNVQVGLEGSPIQALVKNSRSLDEEVRIKVKFLLDNGGNPNYPDKEGNTPLIALFMFTIKQKPFPHDYEGMVQVIELLKKYGADIHHKNNKGYDALYYLENSPYEIDKNYYEIFKQLLTEKGKE